MTKASSRTPRFFSRMATRRGVGVLAGSIAALLNHHSASAAGYTYTATGSTATTSATADLWSTGANWTGTTAPVSGSATTLTFTGTLAAGTSYFSEDDLSGNFQLNSLLFNATAATASAPSFTLFGTTGAALDFVTNGGTGPTLTISSPTSPSSPAVTITEAFVLDATLAISSTVTLNLNNSISGTGGFSKTGAGALVLGGTGTNTFSGPVFLASGSGLQVTNANAFNGNNTITLGGTANFTLTGNITVGAGATVIINGPGGDSFGNFRSNSGTSVWAGNVVVGASQARLGSNGGNLTITGVVSDAGTGNQLWIRTQSSTQAVTFSGSNTYTGTTTIVEGILSVGQINSVTTNSTTGAVHTITSNLGNPTSAPSGTINLGTVAGTGALQATLRYTGAGETTDRVISIQTGNSATNTTSAVIDQSGTGNLKFLSDMANVGTTAATKSLVLQGSTAGTGEFAGVISNGSGPGSSLTLTKQGSGTWTLSNTNTYTGGTSLLGGILAITNASALGGGTITAGNGGLDNTSGGLLTLTNAFTFGAAGSFTYGGSNLLTLTSPITLDTTAHTVTVNGSMLTLSGNIGGGTGTGSFNKAGGGTLLLTGTNSYTSATNINLGTLALSGGSTGGTAMTVGGGTNAAALSIGGNYTIGTASTGTLTVKGGSGPTAGQGSLSLIDNAFNTLTLVNNSGTVLTLGGAVAGATSNVNLEVGGGGNDLIAVGGALSLGTGGAVINLTQLGTNALATGSYALLTFATLAATNSGSFTLGTTPTLSGQVGSYTLSNNGTSEVLTVVYAAQSTTAFWTGAQDAIWNTDNSGSTNFTKNADGTGGFVLPDSTTTVTFSGSTITSANSSTLLGHDFEIAALRFSGTGTPAATNAFTIGGVNTLTIDAGGLSVDPGSANHTISSKVALGADETWTVNNSSTGTFTVSGAISGAHQLTVGSGAGTLILSGSNSYGATVISPGGSLQIVASGSFGTGPVTDNGKLVFNIAGSNSLTVGNSISGSGGLIKAGGLSGTLTLTGSNSYTGVTTISGGVLFVSNSFALGNSSGITLINDTNGGLLQFGGNVSVGAIPLSVTNSAGVVSILSLNGSNSYSGNITATNTGTASTGFRLEADGSLLLSGNISVTGTSGINLFVLQGTGLGEISGNITGNVGLNHSSTPGQIGTWVLSGSNSYSGATSIPLGAVIIGNGGLAGNLPVGSAITVNGGTFGVNRSNAVVQGTDFSGSAIAGTGGSFLQLGSGTTTLNAANSFTGTVSVRNGTLAFSTIGNVSAGASNLGAPTSVATGTIALGLTTNTGALLYTGAGSTTDRVINLAGTTGGGTLDASGSGPLEFTSALTATGVGAKTLTLQGSGLGQLDGAVVNGSGTVALAKAGAGTWTLAGSSTYTGATTVTGAGKLAVSGSLSGTTAVIANNSGTFLLSAANGVNKVNTAATVTLGSAGTPGTLAIANSAGTVSQDFTTLTLNANSTIDFGTGNTGTFRFTSTASNGFSLGTNTLTVADWTGSVYNSATYTTSTDTDHLLTESQFDPTTLANIHFYADNGGSLGTQIDTGGAQEILFQTVSGTNTYEIVPIPEPSTLYSALLAVGLVGLRERRRFRRLAAGRK